MSLSPCYMASRTATWDVWYAKRGVGGVSFNIRCDIFGVTQNFQRVIFENYSKVTVIYYIAKSHVWTLLGMYLLKLYIHFITIRSSIGILERALSGYLISAPNAPITYVIEKKRFQIQDICYLGRFWLLTRKSSIRFHMELLFFVAQKLLEQVVYQLLFY